MTTLTIISPAAKRTASVLVVEDEEAILDGIADLLEFSAENFEIEVSKALNGQEALAQLQTFTPDLIVSDIQMPLMDGLEFLSAVRRNPAWAHIPFIMLTALASPRDVKAGLAQGVELYLTKPFDSRHLIELVETQLGKAMQERSVRQSRSEAMKRTLSRTLQHELRTPLALVTAYLEFIDMSIASEFGTASPNPEELHEYLRGIDVGVRRLTTLVSDIISAIDMQSGKTLTHIRKTATFFNDIDSLVARALSDARRHCEHDHATVSIALPETPNLLFGQRDLIRNALTRLIDNAFKFTKFNGSGAVSIVGNVLNSAEAEAMLGYPATSALQITVQDDGIGFPNHDRFHLQELFYQYDREKWEQQGPGVGLNIVSGIIQGHNGRLRLRGEPQAGATASIILPLYAQSIQPALALGCAPPPKRTVDVLLVEDDEMVRDVFVDLVEIQKTAFEYRILLAENGKEALDLLKHCRPDLIVSDIRMPEMNGLEMLTQLRKDPSFAEIPVIFLTGNRQPEQVHAGRMLGVDEYIAKPYSPDHLFARIETLLNRSFEKQAAESSNFAVLKERVLASIEVGVVASLKAMALHSQTMHDLVDAEQAIEASTDVDELRRSLVSIQGNSSKISAMVAKATMLVDIRTGAAAATFELRSAMIESIGDLIGAVVRDHERLATGLAINFTHSDAPLPLFGNAKMLSTAFDNLLIYFDQKRVSAGTLALALVAEGEQVLLSAEFDTSLLATEAIAALHAVTTNMETCDAQHAELVIFCEYMQLHTARITFDQGALTHRLAIRFKPFDFTSI